MDLPEQSAPVSRVLTLWSPESIGNPVRGAGREALGSIASIAWTANNLAYYYPFRLTTHETAYQLLFWVGATSSGNIDVGIYDDQYKRIVSAGTTAMSATVNTVQELNIADTALKPGNYFLGASCSTTAGTTFGVIMNDEWAMSALQIYEQATALPLPDPAVPVLTTQGSCLLVAIGIQFHTAF